MFFSFRFGGDIPIRFWPIPVHPGRVPRKRKSMEVDELMKALALAPDAEVVFDFGEGYAEDADPDGERRLAGSAFGIGSLGGTTSARVEWSRTSQRNSAGMSQRRLARGEDGRVYDMAMGSWWHAGSRNARMYRRLARGETGYQVTDRFYMSSRRGNGGFISK